MKIGDRIFIASVISVCCLLIWLKYVEKFISIWMLLPVIIVVFVIFLTLGRKRAHLNKVGKKM